MPSYSSYLLCTQVLVLGHKQAMRSSRYITNDLPSGRYIARFKKSLQGEVGKDDEVY